MREVGGAEEERREEFDALCDALLAPLGILGAVMLVPWLRAP